MKRLTSMTAENFLSIGKVELSLTDAGLTLVDGPNGRGKSALIDAVVWCLYGTTLRGYENDEVVHRLIGKDCLVHVRFISSDGDVMYEVRRARKHTKFKNTLTVEEINKGGESTDISKPSTAETQELLDELLGCSKRTFLSSVVFGQDRAYRFSSLTDKEQKEILDEVLGVGRFAGAGEIARKQASSVDDGISTIERDLERVKNARDNAEQDATDLRKKDAKFDDERADKLAAEHARLLKARGFLADNKTTDVGDLKARMEKVEKKILTSEKESMALISQEVEARAMRSAVKARVDELESHVRRHEALTGDCPTCGQHVDEIRVTRVLKDIRKQLVAEKKKLAASDPSYTLIQNALISAGMTLKKARADAVTARAFYNVGVGKDSDIKVWKQRIIDHERRIKEIEEETNPYVALALAAEKKRDKHQREQELLERQLTEEESRLALAKFWVEGFGARGLRSLLLDSSLPLLNREAARVSQMITGGEIEIKFSTTSELKSGKTIDRFDVRVDNKQGAGSYLGNSAGERARVDLCVGLALQRLVASRSKASFNVIFMDEVFDHLDSSAHERVVEVLSEIDKESIFVVSHDENLKAWFPHSITMIKEGGFSRLEDS